MENAYLLATIFVALFGVLGAFDGVYFHLIKYRLYLYPESRLEHQIHTIRALVFIPMAYLFFVENVGGLLLHLALAVFVIDLILELFDILVEKDARRLLWGHFPS